jgi:hypothetical protein
MALGPGLRAVGRVRPRFFPHPVALCVRTRRPTATPTRAAASPRHIAGAGATSLPTAPHPSTAESADARSRPSQTPGARPSTDSPCAARTKRHRQSGAARSTAGLRWAATPRPGTSRESTPTDHRGSATAPASCVAVVLVSPRPPLHHPAPCGPHGACTTKSRLDRGLRNRRKAHAADCCTASAASRITS